MAQVEIRTSDTEWATEYGTPGRDGRTVVTVPALRPTAIAGKAMVGFTLIDGTPADWPNPNGLSPVEWVVDA